MSLKTSVGKKNHDNFSLLETWRAIRYLPCERFPLMLPRVHALAAPFILWRLKRKGYSNCRVVLQDGGLVVFAER